MEQNNGPKIKYEVEGTDIHISLDIVEVLNSILRDTSVETMERTYEKYRSGK